MTLDEAIVHAKEAGIKLMLDCSTYSCGQEHMQLAQWLEELKAFRATYEKPLKEDSII